MELALIRQRLLETAEWCNYHASATDAAESLRSPALRPSNFSRRSDDYYDYDYDWENPIAVQAAVEDLAARRAQLLRQQNIPLLSYPPGIEAGRLLVSIPEDTLTCGLCEYASDGLVDVLDALPWDTWIYYAEETRASDAPAIPSEQEPFVPWRDKPAAPPTAQPQPAPGYRTFHRYILCWIPAVFTPLAAEGIAVSMTDCLFWASDYKAQDFDTPLLRQLEAEGLLY